MNGLARTGFAIIAAIAARVAKRRQRAANKWIDRSARWSAQATEPARENTGLGSRPAPGAAGIEGREPGDPGAGVA